MRRLKIDPPCFLADTAYHCRLDSRSTALHTEDTMTKLVATSITILTATLTLTSPAWALVTIL